MSVDSVVLNEEQQLELSRIAQSRTLPVGYVFCARLDATEGKRQNRILWTVEKL
jgi:hypothetical protein